MKKDVRKFLSDLPLFSLLPKNELKKIARSVSIKQYKKGTSIAVQDKTELKSVSVVAEGSLALFYKEKALAPHTDCTKILSGYHKPGEVFGGISVLMNAGFSTRTVIVEDNCLLYNIPKEIFLDICTRFPAFYDRFLETFGQNMLDESLDLFIKDQVEKWGRERETRIPIITIATEPGSGGSIIAQKIAERMTLDLYEDEIIQDIADSANTSTEKIEVIEKQRLSGIRDFISSLISDRYLWPGLYLTHLKKVVDVIGKHGQAVIVGRGVNFLLPPEKRLSVRIIAPLETRVQNVVRTFGVSHEEAKRRVRNREERRGDFVRNSFSADIADAEHYDLIVNTGGLSIEAAVGAVIGVLEYKS